MGAPTSRVDAEPPTTPYAGHQDAEVGDLSDVCFFVAPIGSDGSDARQHSDLIMGSLVEPALSEFGLRLVRADAIGQSGVFYELALRHAVNRPVVQLIRSTNRIPLSAFYPVFWQELHASF